ncbi:hypothetical protein AGMMS49579_22160 [Spirochaetia bacterium]|nr:hypothetical protein AGMMS49579_22160 [Spirochaetia bacterium]
MPFTKNDSRINRKGRPRKAKVFSTNHEEEHEKEDEFFLWSRKNKFTGARCRMARRWPPKYAAIEKLIEHGIIIEHDDESLEWTLNRESLVDLLYNWPFPNMKWEPVETAFNRIEGSNTPPFRARYLISGLAYPTGFAVKFIRPGFGAA